MEQVEFRTGLPIPEPGKDEALVRLHAAALNHLDVFTIGGLPGINITPPWILGADGAGVIESIGNEVKGVAVGDRVVINPGLSDRMCEYCMEGEHSLCVNFRLLGEHAPGTFAEFIVVPATNVRKIPKDVAMEKAAAFTLVTLTAWRMIVTRARVKAGDDVLIWGIGGGVAQAAMRIAKERGARVWVTSSSDEKLERARALGADETINHRASSVGKEIRARTAKRGVTVVVDSVGHDTWNESLIALGRGGRLVTCGGTSGAQVAMDVRRMFWNQWSLLGSTMGNDAEFDAIVEELKSGKLEPAIDSTFDLEDGRMALERLQSGEHFGKIVLKIAE